MAFIKLIKSRSYSDGSISVKREKPVIEVPDGDASYYIATGFFATTDDEAKAVTTEEDPENTEEIIFPEDEGPVQTAEDRLKADLEGMSVKDLKAYAAKSGIDLAGVSKKDAIISTIVAADRKAAEARDALRQE